MATPASLIGHAYRPIRVPRLPRRGSSLAEIHALERAKWDALAPRELGSEALLPEGESFAGVARRSMLLAGIDAFLGDLRGRRVLEYGCGLGRFTLLLARAGAHVTTFDLSPRSVEYVRRRAEAHGVADRVEAHVAAAERLPFFDESFDVVFGKAILHHVDPRLGPRELRRVLRPGGRAAFSEPLGVNPLLSFARAHLPYPHKHTRGEDQPLLDADLERWTAGFASAQVRGIQLTSMLERALGFGHALPPLRTADSWLLARFPGLVRLCRYAVLLLVR